MRAIDADALLEKVEKIQPWDPYPSKYAQGIRHCMELVNLLIRDAPTIEPQRKTGKWIVVDDAYNRISGKCSVCGWAAHMYEDDVMGMDFCPNCGARLEGEGC